MKPMQLQYIKITNTCYKFFYDEDKEYGEFYLEFLPEHKAEISMKDPAYAKSLMDGFAEALVEYKN